MAVKTCTECGEQLPDDRDHFKKKRDGSMDPKCLICRRRVNKGRRNKKRASSMQDIEAGAMGTFLKAANRGGENIPHSSELLERIMEYVGGVSGFAALVVKQYFDSPPGGAHRTKLIEGIGRLVTKNTELGGAKKPMTQWTDEEIEEELNRRLQKIVLNITEFEGKNIHATLAPQTPSDFAAAFRLPGGAVPEAGPEGVAGRVVESGDGGAEALPAHADAGRDSPVQGERDSGDRGQP
jgi:hypothetical protein